jgi:hypothetical protein
MREGNTTNQNSGGDMVNIRYVVSYINRDGMRKMLGATQGRNTKATKTEAEVYLKAVLGNNTPELLIETYGKDGYETLAVSAIECWPVHNDPKGPWIQQELNPGQEILRGVIKDIMKRLK